MPKAFRSDFVTAMRQALDDPDVYSRLKKDQPRGTEAVLAEVETTRVKDAYVIRLRFQSGKEPEVVVPVRFRAPGMLDENFPINPE